MSLQHFSHQHPLVFIESQGREIEKVYCSGCGELVSGSSFACVECGFYLDKQCAEAPAEMNHPFHRNHNFNLLTRNPYKTGTCTCDFCRKPCENFVYHCSCSLDFHIKCALFSHSIAEKRNAEFQDIPRIDPSIITGNVTEELKKAECFACWKPLLDSIYFSPNCGFYLHAKCVDLPAEINHLFHQEHPLFLQFNSQRLSCEICQEPQRPGFVYSTPTKINQPFHREHPVLLQNVNECLPCQICQETTELDDVVYFCSICKFVLHIRVCLEEVNTKHGSYFCSKCHYIVHVKCATKESYWYYEVDSTETEEETDSDEPVDLREIVAEHSWHHHNLTLSGDFKDFKQCDGCLLPIDTYYYYCSQCDFFLHKACAALPAKKHLWFHYCRKLQKLTSGRIFRCVLCNILTSGFAYACDKCKGSYCLRCSLVSEMPKCEGHEHRLRYFFRKNEELCRGCGESAYYAFTCKPCKFNLHLNCLTLPLTAQHSSDAHPFKLTYHEDDDNYSEGHYCDICEEERNPKHWFYHCSACNTSAHLECVLQEYPFIKPGTIYTGNDHPHPVTFVKKVEFYPECHKCGKHCLDLSLQCKTVGCSYIIHWKCR
ncbi:hypothetical protein E1A91_1Z011100v1 [Gossypium mustelinum]|uniref:Zinc finger PHD-type domain-containing protein n=1 Tax=Gossypium mustelinum TaxID=34275 RepID=A0A5C7J1X9_GOSMU|nr:hypothetical protein E1A91_1Z011100v1 [Gossypium mustelinum]